MCVKFGKQTRSRSWFEKKCASKLVCDVCMSLVNKSEVGAGLKKCTSKLVYNLCMKFNDLYVKRWANIGTFS